MNVFCMQCNRSICHGEPYLQVHTGGEALPRFAIHITCLSWAQS